MKEIVSIRNFKGTWRELLSHQGEIPADSIVELKVYEPNPVENNVGAFGGKTAAEAFQEQVGTVSFESTDIAERAEEYLSPGFGTSKDISNP